MNHNYQIKGYDGTDSMLNDVTYELSKTQQEN